MELRQFVFENINTPNKQGVTPIMQIVHDTGSLRDRMIQYALQFRPDTSVRFPPNYVIENQILKNISSYKSGKLTKPARRR